MTTQELENMGITDQTSKLHPRRYFIPCVGNVNIPETYSKEDIFQLIYDRGHNDGVERGKDEKIDELLSVLKIDMSVGK
jgi:hypothetical protein